MERVAYTDTPGHFRYRMMSNTDKSPPTIYRIRIKGHLGHLRAHWFEGMTITLDKAGDTLLEGPVVDQAALHGLLKNVHDLGVPLLAVNRVQAGQFGTSEVEPRTGTSDSERNENR
jgi:hypothetical protein